jgi:outer membrane protein
MTEWRTAEVTRRRVPRGRRLTVLLALMAWAAWADAAAETPGRIGFFRLGAVYQQTGVQQRAGQEWQRRVAERGEALQRLASELEELQVQLRLEAGRLSPEERQARDEAITRKFEELTRDKERYQVELLRFEQAIQARVAEIISQAATEVGRQQGYAAILEREKSLYYLSKELDVTEAIAEQVKKKMEAPVLPDSPPGSSSTGSPADSSPVSPSRSK